MKFLKLIFFTPLLFIYFVENVYADEFETIINKLDAIESRLTVLEKATFNQTTSGYGSENFGNYQSIIDRQSIQINEIQGEIRKLTSDLEEILFSLQTNINTFNTFKDDTQFRFDDVEAKQELAITSNIEKIDILEGSLEPKTLGTIAIDEGVQNLALQEPASNQSESETQDIINTISQDNLVKLEENAIISILPDGDQAGQYEFAMNLLKQGDFKTAQTAFTEFLTIGTDSELLGDSTYWLAQTFYASENFKDAAKNYLKLSQKYPESNYMPDAISKLGISLAKMDLKEQACIQFIQLQQNYPSADPALLDRNLLEIKNNGCKTS